MDKTKGKGIFIYGDSPNDSVQITWELTAGKELTNQGYWRADILIDLRNDEIRAQQVSVSILQAIRQQFRFKLKTEDGSIFSCGIYSLDDFSEYGVGIYPLEVCSGSRSRVYIG